MSRSVLPLAGRSSPVSWLQSHLKAEQGALLLLIIGTAMNRYRFDVASFGLRIEHAVLLAVGLGFFFRTLGGYGSISPGATLRRAFHAARHVWPTYLEADELLLALYLLVAFASATLNAPSRLESYKYLALMTFCLGVFVVTKRLVRRSEDLRFAVWFIMAVGVIEALWAMAAWLIYPSGPDLGISLYPIQMTPGSDIGTCTFSPQASLFEPNIMASYLSASALMLATWAFSSRRLARSWGLWACLVLTLSGVALSLTRTVWPGLLVGLAGILLLARQRDAGAIAKLLVALAVPALLFVLVSNVVIPCRIGAIPSRLLPTTPPAPAEISTAPTPVSPRAVPSPVRTQPAAVETSPIPAEGQNGVSGVAIYLPFLNALPSDGALPNASGEPEKTRTAQPTPARESSAAPTAKTMTPVEAATPSLDATPAADTGASLTGLTVTRAAATDSLRWRMLMYRDAVVQWLDHPWIGNGPNAFALKNNVRQDLTPGVRAWISNAILMTLHDTGLIGLALLGFWFLWIGLDAWRAYRAVAPGPERTTLFGLLIGMAALLIAYQLTTALWLGFTWVYLGLIRSGTQILRPEKGRITPESALNWLRPRLSRLSELSRIQAWVQANRMVLPVALVGLVTVFFRLNAKGLWGDEVWQVWWSDVGRFIGMRVPTDMPMQFALTALTGGLQPIEFWGRVPSALQGAANATLLYLVGRRVLDKWTGVLAALLLATAPYHVWYAQDARPIAALSFYSLLTLYFFWDYMQHPGRRIWLGLTLATALNVWNHFFGLMPLVIELAFGSGYYAFRCFQSRWKGIGRGAACLRPWMGLIAAGLVPVFPALPLIIGSFNLTMVQGFSFQANTPRLQITGPLLADLFAALGSGGGGALILMLACFAIGCAAALCRHKPIAWLALAWLVLPLAGLAMLQPRYPFQIKSMLFQQPVYLLMAAFGIVQLLRTGAQLVPRFWPRKLPAAPGIVKVYVAGVAVATIVFYHAVPTWVGDWVEKQIDWSAICRFLHQNVQPGDVLTGQG